MKSWFRLSLAVGLMVCSVSVAFAQPGGGGRGGRGGFGGGGFGGGGGGFGGGGGLMLLGDENVKKDLGITDDQVKKMEEFQAKMRDEMGQVFQGLRDLSQEERTAKFQEIQKKMTEMSDAAQKQILLPKQIERLKQISFQSQITRGGGNIGENPDLAKELGITDAQKEAMKKAQEEADAEMREEMTKLRDKARQKVLSVLTAEQQAKIKKLSGETITFAPRQFGGPGGPGGPGGGGPGGAGGRPGGGRPLSRPPEGD